MGKLEITGSSKRKPGARQSRKNKKKYELLGEEWGLGGEEKIGGQIPQHSGLEGVTLEAHSPNPTTKPTTELETLVNRRNPVKSIQEWSKSVSSKTGEERCMIKKQGILARLEWCMTGHVQNSIEWDGQCQEKSFEVVGGHFELPAPPPPPPGRRYYVEWSSE